MPQGASPLLPFTGHLFLSPAQRPGGLGDPHAAAAGAGARVQERSGHTSGLSLPSQRHEMYTQSKPERSAGQRKRCIPPETFPLTFKIAHSQRAPCHKDPLPHPLPWPCRLPSMPLPWAPSSLLLQPVICFHALNTPQSAVSPPLSSHPGQEADSHY